MCLYIYQGVIGGASAPPFPLLTDGLVCFYYRHLFPFASSSEDVTHTVQSYTCLCRNTFLNLFPRLPPPLASDVSPFVHPSRTPPPFVRARHPPPWPSHVRRPSGIQSTPVSSVPIYVGEGTSTCFMTGCYRGRRMRHTSVGIIVGDLSGEDKGRRT